MKTILVSGASGIVGYGILKSLKNLGYGLIGTTIYKDSAANAFCDIFELAPKTCEPNYINWLSSIIKKHKVNMIIPGIEADTMAWDKHRKELEETGTFVLLNNSQLIELCSDKWLFYQKLKENSSKYLIPSSINSEFAQFELPFLLKPRCGFASKGIINIENMETFEKNKDKIGEILMQQPIVGNIDEEYTVSGFFDRQSSLRAYMTLKRKLSSEGFTDKANVVDLDGVKTAIEELARIFKPIGPTNFQFRKTNEGLKLLEINPRISSATSIRAAFGYNESLMSVEYFLNGKIIEQPAIKKGSAIRYTEDLIFYDSNNI
jgi:carbamoyl-phosphate synthase large subunit